jgi:hypothetical protein
VVALTLFSTAGCHLCEEAHALLTEYLSAHPKLACLLKEVEIADHPPWLERYGTRIPVVRNDASGLELSWPFAAEDLPALFQTTP